MKSYTCDLKIVIFSYLQKIKDYLYMLIKIDTSF